MSDDIVPSPPKDRRERVTLALANPVFFGEWYMRPHDQNWSAPLPRFSKEMLAWALSVRRGVCVMPPEFLKTTLLSQLLPLWLTIRATVYGQMLRGMLFSEEEGMAMRNLSVVAWHILHNQMLKEDFADSDGKPLLYPDPTEGVWRDDAIIVARDGISKDPTWQAKGLDSKGIQGRRLDWLIGDDVITPRNAFSPAMRKKAIDLWDLQITTRVVADGKILISGNFNDSRDMLSTLRSRKGYRSFVRPAYHAPGQPTKGMDPEKPGAVATWPENWSIARGMQEKEEKPKRFARIFLLDPRAEEGDVLNVGWMTIIPEADIPTKTPLKYSRFIIALDPAPGGETADVEDLDFFTITVVALHDVTGLHCDIVESLAFRDDITEQIKLVGAVHDRYQRVGYGVIAICGAKVAMDAYMRGALVIARPDLAPKIEPISTPGQKEQRLEGLGMFARSGYLRCWESAWYGLTSDPADQHQELTLYDEWKDFPFATHDDRLDGVDVAVRGATELNVGGDQEYDIAVLEA
jgi:hypothetical protein